MAVLHMVIDQGCMPIAAFSHQTQAEAWRDRANERAEAKQRHMGWPIQRVAFYAGQVLFNPGNDALNQAFDLTIDD